jgi:hypothetical protein
MKMFFLYFILLEKIDQVEKEIKFQIDFVFSNYFRDDLS